MLCCTQPDAARQSLADWLEKNRLTRHEIRIAEIAGPDRGIDDLPLLSEEDVAALISTMTNVEARRFEAAREAILSHSQQGSSTAAAQPQMELAQGTGDEEGK